MNVNQKNYIDHTYTLGRSINNEIRKTEFEKLFDQKEKLTSVNALFDTIGNDRLQGGLKLLVNPTSSTKRYQFQTSESKKDKRDLVLTLFFHHAFKTSPRLMIDSAAKADPSKPFYPLWKRVCCIDLPKTAGNIIGSIPFIAIAMVVSGVCSIKMYIHVNTATAIFTATRLVPFVINNTPVAVIKLGNLCVSGFSIASTYKFQLFFYLLIAKIAIEILPTIPSISEGHLSEGKTEFLNHKITVINNSIGAAKVIARRIDPIAILMFFIPHSSSHYREIISCLLFVPGQCVNLSSQILSWVREHENNVTNNDKKHAHAVWNDLAERYKPSAA